MKLQLEEKEKGINWQIIRARKEKIDKEKPKKRLLCPFVMD